MDDLAELEFGQRLYSGRREDVFFRCLGTQDSARMSGDELLRLLVGAVAADLEDEDQADE